MENIMRQTEKETGGKYADIIHMERPVDAAILRRHPRMPLEERAKIFAPFAALRGHSERLSEEGGKLLRSRRAELSEEETERLSHKLSQVQKGTNVAVTHFLPETPGAVMGYYTRTEGTVTGLDVVRRLLKITCGEEGPKGLAEVLIRFEDITDILWEE